MLEKTNSVYIIGTLVEVKKHQTGTFTKEGKDVPYVSTTIIVKCDINGQENLIQLENFTSGLKKDGTVNKNYNTILNIKDLLNERVVISGASLAGNRFWSPRTEQLVAATKINFNLINKATSVQTEDKAEFKFGGFVLRELAEKIDAEGNLEYYTITIAQANYGENDMMEVQFTLPKDNIAAVNGALSVPPMNDVIDKTFYTQNEVNFSIGTKVTLEYIYSITNQVIDSDYLE